MRGAFSCVGWQVTLCDLTWQVTSHSSEMGSHEELYRPLPFTFLLADVKKAIIKQYFAISLEKLTPFYTIPACRFDCNVKPIINLIHRRIRQQSLNQK